MPEKWNFHEIFCKKENLTKNSPFLAKHKVLEQNSIKKTPLKVQFYNKGTITSPKDTFSRSWQWHEFDFGLIFTHLLANWSFAARFTNCSNSLNFEAKINFKTRQNDLKWQKTCTGLKFDLEHFNGPQTKFIVDSLYEHPVPTER